ncbi:hypothetical protein BSKO_06558 [Bryopsis sp. KO-2023]|nr:hypothetical protein BSKO_06558 [Bryopsis sp. KO-2023]
MEMHEGDTGVLHTSILRHFSAEFWPFGKGSLFADSTSVSLFIRPTSTPASTARSLYLPPRRIPVLALSPFLCQQMFQAYSLPSPSGVRPTPTRSTPVCCSLPSRLSSRQSLRGNVVARRVSLDIRESRRLSLTVSARQGGGGGRRDREDKEFEERVVHVTRVSKTVKGGRNISFRAVVVVGNRKGTVGVGNSTAKEVSTAVQKAGIEAKRNMIKVPLHSKTQSFPHRTEVTYGAARVMLRPAADGTGVIAGGAVRVVLELAGVKNGFGKQLGSDNAMNNAKAALLGLGQMRTHKEVAEERGVTVDYLLGRSFDPTKTAAQWVESQENGTSLETEENTAVAEVQPVEA